MFILFGEVGTPEGKMIRETDLERNTEEVNQLLMSRNCPVVILVLFRHYIYQT